MLIDKLKKNEHICYADSETANLAKLSGFNEDTIFFYNWIGKIECDEDYYVNNRNIYDTLSSMPTLSCLRNWIEVEFNLYIEIKLDRTTRPKYCFEIYKYLPRNEWEIYKVEPCNLYLYRSREECLEEAIKLILKQNKK